MFYLSAAILGLIGTAVSLVGAGVLLSVPLFAVAAVVVALGRKGVPLKYNLRSLLRRKTSTGVALGAVALVAFVLHGTLMMAGGVATTMNAGDPNLLRVIRKGSTIEALSDVSPEHVRRVMATVGASADNHEVVVAPELVTLTIGRRVEHGAEAASVSVRGVTEASFQARPNVVIEGRRPAAGTSEIAVGKSLVGQLEGAQVGGRMEFSGADWTVVGIVDHGGTPEDSEVWADYGKLSASMRRRHTSITVRSSSVEIALSLAQAIANEPGLVELEALTDQVYWGAKAEKHVTLIALLGSLLALIFSIGAGLGLANTMSNLMDLRRREIGTMRALGFKRKAVLVSIAFEAAALGASAGLLGVVVSWAVLGNREFALTNEQLQSEITYPFVVSPFAAVATIAAAMFFGYAGGLLPAMRTARTPVVDAVRA